MPYTPMCSINPVIGNELRWEQQYRPAETPGDVVVVGGGIAGCEAARVAAMRGHQVILLEQGKRLGGQLLIAARAPGRDSFEDQAYFEGKTRWNARSRGAAPDQRGSQRNQVAVARGGRLPLPARCRAYLTASPDRTYPTSCRRT
jgi:NADPH-dependent 2,4-dienoyl-CoA reductase/sulfur reductase-like enzyme